MSWLRPPPEEDPLEPVDVEVDDPLDPDELLVEYFVDVLEDCPVSISVPKSVHSSHTSSSAPSILTRFGFAVSVPHISH
jgi:hypothetical protein